MLRHGPGSNAVLFFRSVSKQKNERIKNTSIYMCANPFFNYVASLSIWEILFMFLLCKFIT